MSITGTLKFYHDFCLSLTPWTTPLKCTCLTKGSLIMLVNIYWFTTTHWNLKSRLRNFCLTTFIVVSRIYHLFIVFLSVKRVKKPKKTIWCDFTEWKSKDTRIAPNVIESENGSQTSVVTKFFEQILNTHLRQSDIR